jgi:hypothetical protein
VTCQKAIKVEMVRKEMMSRCFFVDIGWFLSVADNKGYFIYGSLGQVYISFPSSRWEKG